MSQTFRSPYRLEIVSNKSRHGGRAAKRHMFFLCVSDKADGYFVNFPLEWGFEVLLGKMFGNKGLEIRYLRYAQSFGDIMCSEIRGLGF